MYYYKIKVWYLGMTYYKEYVGTNFGSSDGVLTFTDPDNDRKTYKISANSADCIEYESFNGDPPKGFNNEN
jgi:hypothetical protein